MVSIVNALLINNVYFLLKKKLQKFSYFQAVFKLFKLKSAYLSFNSILNK